MSSFSEMVDKLPSAYMMNTHPYPIECAFVSNVDEFKELRLTLDGTSPIDINDDVSGMTSCSTNKLSIIIGVFQHTSAVLIHECAHAAIITCSAVGLPINIATQEAFAYFIESLYTQCSNFLNEEYAKE